MPAAVNVISMTLAQQSEKEILHSFYTSNRKVPVSVYLTFLLSWQKLKEWLYKNVLRFNLWFFKRYLFNSNVYSMNFEDLNINLGALNDFLQHFVSN